MISEKTIDAVRNLDIEDVLKSAGVQFTQKGRRPFAHCPFHSEKTPSFSISPEKNLYYCHSCHRGGDGIKFYMEKEGMDFFQAVEAIAKANNLHIEYIKGEQTDEQKKAALHRESLLAAVSLIHKFFYEQLRVEMNDEARAAREYAYNRWPEEFCATRGIGLAPKDSRLLMEYCKSKAISEDLLVQSGIYQRDKKSGRIYTLFKNRLIIPIHDRFGRVVAFTARYLGDDKADNVGKYINSANSKIFDKGESIYGIDRASRCRNAVYFNIVEGAPDVLRLQSIGFENTVATLGTAWSCKQFDKLIKFKKSVCFIPDSDPPKDEPFGPGFKAVMKNGAEAIRRGFDVTVRELPFNEEPIYVPLFDFEIEEAENQLLKDKVLEARKAGASKKELAKITLTDSERGGISRQKKVGVIYHKNDADEYIQSPSIYASLTETPFIIWLAEKRFSTAASNAEERKYLAEIADLLRFVSDKILFDELIDALSDIYGKAKSWRMAVDKAKADAAKKAKEKEPQSERERDIELLKKFNLTIRDNCYFTFDGDDEPTRLSNFILEPLFHIEDETNGTRLFRMRNSMGDVRVIELRESDLCSLSAFTQRVGSAGNFVWRAKADKLNNVKEYTYAKTRTAERIRKLGWDIAGEFFAFGNGIFVDGKFKRVDELGIVSDVHNANYYIPATSKMYRHNPEIFQFERLMIHEDNSGITLRAFASKLCEVFGDQSKIALCYLLSTIFRDIIYKKTRHFPILNLFGEKGSGKTTLAVCLQSFFLHGIEPPSIGVTSVPAMNDRVSQAVNTFVVFDEYRNDLDVRKIQFLKGMWGGGGQTKKNANTDGMAAQTIVSTGVAVCGQDKPTQDMALFTRLIFLQYNRTVFTAAEQNRCGDLVAICNLGLTHLTLQILSHRSMFEKNFAQAYALTKSELSAKTEDEEIHSRIFGNWVIPLATFRVLETVLDLPFSYSEIFDIALKGMRSQNEFAQESSEVADFWNTLQGMHSAGRCIEKAHFRIRYQRTFRSLSMKEDMIFAESKPILYLNAAAVAALFNGSRGANATANRSNWSTILSYLKSHPSFLGLKQDRFVILTAQGTPDYTVESTTFGTSRKQKVNRPKALCFDYSQLKEAFGLTLETETITEAEEIDEDAEQTRAAVPEPPAPEPASLFSSPDDEDTPF